MFGHFGLSIGHFGRFAILLDVAMLRRSVLASHSQRFNN